MSHSTRSPVSAFAGHGRAFVVAALVGLVLALGVRSMFVDMDGVGHEAHAGPKAGEHDGPGHGEHAHDAMAPAPEEDKKGEDGHGGHEGHGAKGGGMDGTADGAKDAAGGSKATGVLLDLKNADCPVMGGENNGKTFTEWNGLRVGHCCPGCRKRFLKNPESLLDDVSKDWRKAAKAAKDIDAASGKARAKLLKSAGKTWPVLRRPTAAVKADAPGLLVDLGNANCPVMGGEVDGKTFTEWNGLRVGHCCPGCSKRFLKTPEKLLDEVAPDWRKAAAAVKKANEAKGKAREKAVKDLSEKWPVVRGAAAEGTK